MVKAKKEESKEILMETIKEIKEKTKLVTADIGSFNIKTSLGGIYENRFILDNDGETFGSEVLDYNGNKYLFSQGSFDLTFGKAYKEIEVPLIYALGKDMVEGNVNLITHLPSSQMDNKPQIIERLLGKTFKYKINGEKEKLITFNTVGVLKEGFSSFYALAKRNQGLIAIVDIGGRTTDVFCFIDGVLVKEITIPIGTMDYFINIAEKLTVDTGTKKVLEDIHPLLKHNKIDLRNYENITNEIYKKMIKYQKSKIDDLGNYDIHLTGGGAEYFLDNFKETYKSVCIMPNNLSTNVEGAQNIGKAKGLDK